MRNTETLPPARAVCKVPCLNEWPTLRSVNFICQQAEEYTQQQLRPWCLQHRPQQAGQVLAEAKGDLQAGNPAGANQGVDILVPPKHRQQAVLCYSPPG